MDLREASSLAHSLMGQHGLNQWYFRFDSSVKRFGCCNYTKRIISLSRALTMLNSPARVANTVLHEIAHALAGPQAKHGRLWRLTAIRIGCDGNRCYDSAQVAQPKMPWKLTCPKCGGSVQRIKRPKRAAAACGRCCKLYNGGRYSSEFQLTVTYNY